jgi:integrase/recombinase XerC
MAYIKKVTTYKKRIEMSDGTFEWKLTIRWQVGWYDLDNKKHRKNLNTKKEAEYFKAQIELNKYRIKNGFEQRLNPNLPFEKALDEYRPLVVNYKKEITISNEWLTYKSLLRFIPTIKIRDVTRTTINQFITHRLKECEVKPATVNKDLRHLKAFFNVMMKYDYVQSNPVVGVKGPKEIKKEPRALSNEEIKKLIKVIDSDDYRDLIWVYLSTGARYSELLPPKFTWDNVDFKNSLLTFNGKFDKVYHGRINKRVYEILNRRKHIEKHEFPFNFNKNYCSKMIKKYLIKAKLSNVTTHNFRSTFASKLNELDANLLYVQRLLGHEDMTTTRNHYINIGTDELLKTAKLLDDAWSDVDDK